MNEQYTALELSKMLDDLYYQSNNVEDNEKIDELRKYYLKIHEMGIDDEGARLGEVKELFKKNYKSSHQYILGILILVILVVLSTLTVLGAIYCITVVINIIIAPEISTSVLLGPLYLLK